MAKITQIVTPEGKPAAVATKATGWFIHDGQKVDSFPDYKWGDTFSEPSAGNDVEFFYTGAKYFTAIKEAIEKAKRKIYITGWQINFDVKLAHDGLTLYEHLRRAMEKNPTLEVYVMPWMSPKVGVDTGDFDTLLAMAQLNAGKPKGAASNPPQRAFTLLAMEQTDMPGSLAIGFSHHQKLVVVDDEIAFVGGIDLAYGRRDTGAFFLEADGRTGSELYNPCIPPMHTISKVEGTRYVYRWELFSGCFSGATSWTGEFIFSASALPMAMGMDGMAKASERVGESKAGVDNWLDGHKQAVHKKWIAPIRDKITDAVIAQGSKVYKDADKRSGGALEEGRRAADQGFSNTATVMVRWLKGESLTDLAPAMEAAVTTRIRLETIAMQSRVQNAADNLDEKYKNLELRRHLFPRGGKIISSGQPRMPWHDVQCGIRGPSVIDLSRNFVDRWNGLAHLYESPEWRQASEAAAKSSLSQMGEKGPPPQIKRLIAPPLRAKPGAAVDKKVWVQVLRSAPRKMLKDEAAAKKSALYSPVAQNNCLKAMLTAIQGAKYFIYIEGQFFQSAYGSDLTSENADDYSPMAAMTDFSKSPRWKKYEKELGLVGVPKEQALTKLNYLKTYKIIEDKSFMKDLKFAVSNAAAAQASQALGKPQDGILNPIGQALVQRIERAIADGTPFHIYMVLPVHPEGTLNTLNIMTQIHYTMQSLVFGRYSLINGIRRAIVAGTLRGRNKGMSMTEAILIVDKYTVENLIDLTGEEWKRYVTLLNLRNWTMLTDPLTKESRPVTEQIYVHSKLLIADDLVAILGSANINDRSQLGDRDSELAVIIRDDASVIKKIDGKSATPVSAKIYDLRRYLWSKIFGLLDGARLPAHALAGTIDTPASEKTWTAIQKVAHSNALAYQHAFPFLPKADDTPSSIWPTWDMKNHKLASYMPFDVHFWRNVTEVDKKEDPFTWAASSRAHEKTPSNVQGFIVTVPTNWTMHEKNDSRINKTLLARNESDDQIHQNLTS